MGKKPSEFLICFRTRRVLPIFLTILVKRPTYKYYSLDIDTPVDECVTYFEKSGV